MAIVLDSNQVGIFCDRVQKEPELLLLDITLPPNVLAELILWKNKTLLYQLCALKPRVGLSLGDIVSAIASSNQDEIRAFRPFPSHTTVHPELYDELVNAIKNPSDLQQQWAIEKKKKNKDFCGQMKDFAKIFRKQIHDNKAAGIIQGTHRCASMEEAWNAFGKGSKSFIGSIVSATIFDSKLHVAITDPEKRHNAVMANPFIGGFYRMMLFYTLSYSRMWDHNHQNLNFDPESNRDDWTDMTIPLYAAPGDTILTQDTKLFNAIGIVYGSENILIKKAVDL
jgi:hypothetical protein